MVKIYVDVLSARPGFLEFISKSRYEPVGALGECYDSNLVSE